MPLPSEGDRSPKSEWWRGQAGSVAFVQCHRNPIAAGDGTTNLAFDAGERRMYVSVVTRAADPKAMGSIVRVDNVR